MGLHTGLQQLVTDSLSYQGSVGFIERGLVQNPCSWTINLDELVTQAYDTSGENLSFLGNGSEALVFRVDCEVLKSPFAVKIFYDSLTLEQKTAELLVQLLAESGDTTELLYSPNNEFSWLSSADWHIKTLAADPRPRFTRRMGSPKQNALKSYWAHHLAGSLSPLVDAPYGGVCHRGELVGYAMPFYEGKFFSLGAKGVPTLDTSVLEENGVLLDRSTYGYNAVALPSGECKIFDLKLRPEALKFGSAE